MRHVTTTGCCNKSPRVAYENPCHYDRISSLQSVAQIQTGLNLCDISQQQTKRKRLVAAAVQMMRLVTAICHIVCLGLYRLWLLVTALHDYIEVKYVIQYDPIRV